MTEIIVLKTFAKATKKLMSKNDIEMLAKILKENPKAGDVIRGSGGVRKLRFARDKGKSSGFRIIYFFQDSKGKVFLITAYTKADKINLTQSEVNTLKKLTEQLNKGY
jgi:hypothetical protein